MQFDSNTFCAAPWFQIRNANLGDYRVCCDIDLDRSTFLGQKQYNWPQHSVDDFFNSEYVHHLRRGLTNGEQLPECHKCWKKERLGMRSQRNTVNDACTTNRGHDLVNSWISAFMKHQQNYRSDLLVSADVKLTNVCNYSCMICHPADSSQIYSQWRQHRESDIIKFLLPAEQDQYFAKIETIFQEKRNHEHLVNILQRRPRFLKLLGGEPLLDKNTLDILADLPYEQKKSTSVTFITNGSKRLCAVYEYLDGFRSVDFVVSIDGVGPVQNFVRKGSDWHQLTENVLEFNRRFPGHLYVHAVSHALTLATLPDLVAWCRDMLIPITADVLIDPDFMSFAAVPDDVKCDLLQNLVASQDPVLSETKADLESAIWLPELTNRLAQYLRWYDPADIRFDLFPAWKGYFNYTRDQ